MNYKRLKELSAAGFPVALAPEQLLRVLQERDRLRARAKRLKALETVIDQWRECDVAEIALMNITEARDQR